MRCVVSDSSAQPSICAFFEHNLCLRLNVQGARRMLSRADLKHTSTNAKHVQTFKEAYMYSPQVFHALTHARLKI